MNAFNVLWTAVIKFFNWYEALLYLRRYTTKNSKSPVSQKLPLPQAENVNGNLLLTRKTYSV